jgi:hypothetical protein
MKRLSKFRKSEIDLGRYSKQLAESESQLVAPDRLAEAITKFIEWRAFSYWLRLVVERDGCVSQSMSAILSERCPGFLEYAASIIQKNRSFCGFASWNGSMRLSFALLRLRAGAMRLAINRCVILEWTGFGCIGSSASVSGRSRLLRLCRALMPGVSPPCWGLDPRPFRLQELRYPECRVLVENWPADVLRVTV